MTSLPMTDKPKKSSKYQNSTNKDIETLITTLCNGIQYMDVIISNYTFLINSGKYRDGVIPIHVYDESGRPTKNTVNFTKKDYKFFKQSRLDDVIELTKYFKARPKKKRGKINTGAFKQLTRYTFNCVDFFRETIASNDSLKSLSNLKFLTEGQFKGIAAANMITQLWSLIIIKKKMQNDDDKQLIKPDAIMLKYFADGIKETLTKQYAKEEEKIAYILEYNKKIDAGETIGNKKNVPVRDSIAHPGEIRHPYIQTLMGKHRTNQKLESPEIIAFLKSENSLANCGEDMENVSTSRRLLQENREDELREHRKKKRSKVVVTKETQL